MSRVFNTTRPVTMSAINYDPIAHIGDILPNEKLRARTLSSLAWYLDRQLSSEVRGLFFKLYEQLSDPECNSTTIDSYSTFLNVMKEEDGRRTNLVEQGFMEGSGVGSIRTLICLRDTFHSAASAMDERHKVPSIDALMAEDRPMKVDALSKAKSAQLAKFMAKGNEVIEARLLAELIARKESRAIDFHERRVELVPALTGMLHFINNTSTVSDAEFHDLPVLVQKRLVQQLVSIIERAVSECSDDRKVTEFEFVKIMIEGEGAIEAVKAVLAQHTYAQSDEAIDGSVAIDHKRNVSQEQGLEAALAE